MAFNTVSEKTPKTATIKSIDQARSARNQNLPGDFENWAELAKHADTPATAMLIVSFLDKAPELKLRHAGLYLRAANVVQTIQAARARELAEKAREAAQQQANDRAQAIAKAKQVTFFVYRCVRIVPRALFALFEMLVVRREMKAQS